jgi:hypothetical protein
MIVLIISQVCSATKIKDIPPLSDKEAFGMETVRRWKRSLEELAEEEKTKGGVYFLCLSKKLSLKRLVWVVMELVLHSR